MEKIEAALWHDYKEVTEKLSKLTVGSDQYTAVLESQDQLRNELIKLKQIEEETNVKKFQIESENKREDIRNKITIVTFVVTTGVSIYSIAKTFKFDQVATVTSTLGRNILNGAIPKLLKR